MGDALGSQPGTRPPPYGRPTCPPAASSTPCWTTHRPAAYGTGSARPGGCSRSPILAASPEPSLAWKPLWLASDIWPQGKDLYDAVLLAERVALPRDLMHEVLRDALGEREGGDFGPETIRSLEVDWDEFRAEYPHVTGSARDWLDRLARALEAAFSKK
ncbi:hypothetical protein [Microbispora bryophytorum]|uniref:hypothetical protein n=1 Tax=Microbispora bryophytorum TaxID=1460882 RepID=UPI0033CCD548